MPILKYGLMQLKEWGVENIQAYCGELIQPLKSSLRKLGITFENDAYFSNHLFALDLPAQMDSELVRQKINENKIIISVRGDSLRVSVNVFNDQENIHALIQVLENV